MAGPKVRPRLMPAPDPGVCSPQPRGLRTGCNWAASVAVNGACARYSGAMVAW